MDIQGPQVSRSVVTVWECVGDGVSVCECGVQSSEWIPRDLKCPG